MPAGYCLATEEKYPPVFEIKKYGIIHDLAVTERYRRNGISISLFIAAQQWFTGHDISRIKVQLVRENEVSKAFWKKMGFEPPI